MRLLLGLALGIASAACSEAWRDDVGSPMLVRAAAARGDLEPVRVRIDADVPVTLHAYERDPLGDIPNARRAPVVCPPPCVSALVPRTPITRMMITGGLTHTPVVDLGSLQATEAEVFVRRKHPGRYWTGLSLAVSGSLMISAAAGLAFGAISHDGEVNDDLAPHQRPVDSFADGPTTPLVASFAAIGVVAIAVGLPLALTGMSEVSVRAGDRKIDLVSDGIRLRF